MIEADWIHLFEWRASYELCGFKKYRDFFYLIIFGQLWNSLFLENALHHGVCYFYVLQYLNPIFTLNCKISFNII